MRVRTIKFSERAVACIDLAGFKNLVREAHASTGARRKLSRLMRTIRSNEPLNRVVNHPVSRELHPKSLEISDSIILSTPLTHPDHSWYSGLAVMVMRCSQIAAILFEEGYLVTGAINVGPVHHTQHNIVGMPYQDAYEWQSKIESCHQHHPQGWGAAAIRESPTPTKIAAVPRCSHPLYSETKRSLSTTSTSADEAQANGVYSTSNRLMAAPPLIFLAGIPASGIRAARLWRFR